MLSESNHSERLLPERRLALQEDLRLPPRACSSSAPELVELVAGPVLCLEALVRTGAAISDQVSPPREKCKICTFSKGPSQ